MEAMEWSWKTVADLLGLLAVLVLGGIALVRWLKRSRDNPPVLIFKWLFTALLLYVIFTVRPLVGSGPYLVLLTLTLAMIAGVLWAPNIAEVLFRPIWNAFTGGDEEPEPRPFYSIARAKRKRGQAAAALADVRAQLARFPNDFEGQMLAAEILAEDMRDLEGAELTIQRLCEQPGHTPQNLAYALSTLADWYLRIGQDPENARRVLEQLLEKFPDTDLAITARQRLARMPTTEWLAESHEPTRIVVRKGIENIGLQRQPVQLTPPPESPETLAARYVAQLEQHPDDFETREKLALLYADAFGRLDLAEDQLEQLIQHSNAPPAQVAHWLHLLADLQVRHGRDEATVRRTLERVEELFPNSPHAEQARRRLNLLPLEFKSKQKRQAIKLGVYEQNLGLKRGLPG
ncbi:MAG: tetratricopeptide repeat protein [Limisphaera sp.]